MKISLVYDFHEQFIATLDFTDIFAVTALSLKPDDALVLKRRADMRGKLSMKAEAIEDYRQAVEIQSRLRAMK